MNRDVVISEDFKLYPTPRYAQKENSQLHKPNAPYRTIVSGIDWSTERIAEVAEHELNKFIETSPSYIRDTTDFICMLQEIDDPNPIVSFWCR